MLNLISTPIGNLNDISLRAIDVLKDADYIFAEDTRNTNKLLKAINIDKKCRTLHEHNEVEVSKEIISLLKNKKTEIALVSDAGTPAGVPASETNAISVFLFFNRLIISLLTSTSLCS